MRWSCIERLTLTIRLRHLRYDSILVPLLQKGSRPVCLVPSQLCVQIQVGQLHISQCTPSVLHLTLSIQRFRGSPGDLLVVGFQFNNLQGSLSSDILLTRLYHFRCISSIYCKCFCRSREDPYTVHHVDAILQSLFPCVSANKLWNNEHRLELSHIPNELSDSCSLLLPSAHVAKLLQQRHMCRQGIHRFALRDTFHQKLSVY